jgi:DNA-binding LytR/AlgR family response regulator
MLLIGICDGDTAIRIMLGNFIKRYKAETGLTAQVLSYDSGEKLLHHYPFDMDLIFLEIPLIGMSGLETARKIREIDANVGIVFLTSVFAHVFEAYEVRANNYFIKPLKYNRFLKEVEQAREKRGQNRFFIEQNDDGVYKIYTKTIKYITTIGQNTQIFTENEVITSYKRMKTHANSLYEPYFVRCHAGFIVNLLFFEKIEQNDLILTTGEIIPVSRQRKKEVLQKIKNMGAENGGAF